MNLSEYKRIHRGEAVTKDVRDRWSDRIVPNGWHVEGKAGGEAYLRRYGRRIGAKKCIKLANWSETKGYKAIALAFWEKAFVLDHPDTDMHSGVETAVGSARELPDVLNM
jgi:hypothetical protein